MSETPAIARPRFIDGLGELQGDYDAILCDVWGVVHNGREAFPDAVEALSRFRRGGGVVVLITNAPRPNGDVARMLDRLGARREAYDAIVTSGDVTAHLIAEREGQKIFHLGPDRDNGLFDIAAKMMARPPLFSSGDDADYILCTGLFDDAVETPADYEARLSALVARHTPFLCANPDIVVQRGGDLVYCAGALAKLYEELGGEVVYAGKPHPPIYVDAMAAVRSRLPAASAERTLAIGDALQTDIAGATAAGLDALFILGGIHGQELGVGEDDAPDSGAALRIFSREGLQPRYVATALRP